jgi:hypothetical protein
VVTLRCGSPSKVTVVGGSTCAGGAVRNPARSRRDSPNGWLGKLYQGTQRRYTEGIGKWRGDLPGPCSPVSGRSSARVIWGLW